MNLLSGGTGGVGGKATSARPRVARFAGKATALALALLQGCAINPYVLNPQPPESTRAALERVGVANPNVRAGETLARSMDKANRFYDGYEAKLSEEFQRQQALSSGVISLAALAVTLAAGKAHPDALIATAILGGTVYQLGTWNTSQNRLGIYIEGMKAIACAKGVMAPMQTNRDQIDRVRRVIDDLLKDQEKAMLAAGRVTAWRAIVANTRGNVPVLAIEQDAATALVAYRQAVNEANELLGNASNFERRATIADAVFDAKIDEIRTAIDKALEGSQANLDNLPKFVASLSDYANMFVPGVKLDATIKSAAARANVKLDANGAISNAQSGLLLDPAGGGQPGAQTGTVSPVLKLAEALGQLEAGIGLMSRNASLLRGAADFLTTAQVGVNLAGCGVKDAGSGGGVKLTRQTVSFRKGTAGTAIVEVRGGTRPYTASLMDLPAKGISVTASAGGLVITVVADTETEAGKSYVVKVADANDVSSLLTIQIEDPNAAGGGGAVNPTGGGSPAPALKCEVDLAKLTTEDVCLVQSQIGTPVDGDFGPRSCTAFYADRVTSGLQGKVTAALVGKFKTDHGLAADAGPAVVRQKLESWGLKNCKATSPKGTAAAPPGLPGVGGAVASGRPKGSGLENGCAPIRDESICSTKMARCELECRMSVTEVSDLRRDMGLAPAPVEFDAVLRDKLLTFQNKNNLKAKFGEYNVETAGALAKPAAPASR